AAALAAAPSGVALAASGTSTANSKITGTFGVFICLTGTTNSATGACPGSGNTAIDFGSVQLDGLSGKTVSRSQNMWLQDWSGTGNGWTISVGMSQPFTDGTHTLADGSLTITGVSLGCAASNDQGGECTGTLPSGNAVSYPVTVPTQGGSH